MFSFSMSASIVFIVAEVVRHRIDYWHKVQYSIDWRPETARQGEKFETIMKLDQLIGVELTVVRIGFKTE